MNGIVERVAIIGIGVHVASDDELGAGDEPADIPVVVVNITAAAGRDVILPEANLIVVALAVAVLSAVENGWRGMAGEEVDRLAADGDRNVHVVLGREAQDRLLLIRIKRAEIIRPGQRRVV